MRDSKPFSSGAALWDRAPYQPSFPTILMIRFIVPLFIAVSISTFAQTPPADHGHGTGAEFPGLKKEMFAGITVDDLLKLGDKPKSVKIVLVATFNGANYGMNFNGYSHGNAVLTVPLDWTVNVTFINPSPIPHSAIVIDKADVKKLRLNQKEATKENGFQAVGTFAYEAEESVIVILTNTDTDGYVIADAVQIVPIP